MASSHDPISVIPHGATLTKLSLPSYPTHNLILALPHSSLYETHNKPYFGETIGRVANRIDDAVVPDLNGKSYELPANDGKNCLHGGGIPPDGGCWGKRQWSGSKWELRHGKETQKWEYVSPHMEGGLPGEVTARVWYSTTVTTSHGKEEVCLEIEHEAEMTGEPTKEDNVHETVVALANHSYYNASSGLSLSGVQANFGSINYLPVNSTTKIPLGNVEKWPSLIPDAFVPLSDDLVMDHCFVLDKNPTSTPLDTRDRQMTRAITQKARAPDGNTDIFIEIETTEPAVQIYTGDGINLDPGPDGKPLKGWENRGARAGMAIEPERYVNAAGHGGVSQGWRRMVTLTRGDIYGSKSRVRCWLE